MMSLRDLLSVEDVFVDVHARCKRGLLATLAEKAALSANVAATVIEAALTEREQLGSTGVGNGVAIPHGKIDGLSDIKAFFFRLDAAIDFEAIDDEPVDLVVLLLAPSNATAAHLKALAKVSRLMREASVRQALRGAETAEGILAITHQDQHSNAA
ncbi:MAG: PTS sugar transporter subunit IIA [Pseudomonadota bacterium]